MAMKFNLFASLYYQAIHYLEITLNVQTREYLVPNLELLSTYDDGTEGKAAFVHFNALIVRTTMHGDHSGFFNSLSGDEQEALGESLIESSISPFTDKDAAAQKPKTIE